MHHQSNLGASMTSASVLDDIPGGGLLHEWFGRMPSFHDAKLLEVSFLGKGAGMLRIHAWNTTKEVDSQGYLVLDKHAVVTFDLEGVSAINCEDFDMMPGIIYDLQITKVEGKFSIEWGASYGVSGCVSAKQIRLALKPGMPE
jgi:hypothetical protein